MIEYIDRERLVLQEQTIHLQLLDIDELVSQDKGKGITLSDFQTALQLQKDDLKRELAFICDLKMAQSVADAVLQDSEELERVYCKFLT
jgi:hypothetical protein